MRVGNFVFSVFRCFYNSLWFAVCGCSLPSCTSYCWDAPQTNTFYNILRYFTQLSHKRQITGTMFSIFGYGKSNETLKGGKNMWHILVCMYDWCICLKKKIKAKWQGNNYFKKSIIFTFDAPTKMELMKKYRAELYCSTNIKSGLKGLKAILWLRRKRLFMRRILPTKAVEKYKLIYINLRLFSLLMIA